jgi:hypothetical protein
MKVTKWSTHSGELTVSEHQAEQTPNGGNFDTSFDAGSAASEPTIPLDLQAAQVAVSVLEPVVEPSMIAPDQEAPVADEAPQVEAVKTEAPKVGIHKADAAPDAERPEGKLLIMSPGDRTWREAEAEPRSASAGRGMRRLPAMAAMVALATIAGMLGGALATTGLMHVADAGAATSPPGNSALEATVARIDADIVALKAGLEQTSRTGTSQFNKTSDRLERIEKAQVEPAAKLAKLSEAVEKLRNAQQAGPVTTVAAAAATSKDITGSVTPPSGAAPLPMPPAAAATTPKTEVGRLPTVDGWYLADVGYGGALIQNRRTTYEVYAGDFVPGLGRIDAVRKQDGRWVVVTSKGLIVAR